MLRRGQILALVMLSVAVAACSDDSSGPQDSGPEAGLDLSIDSSIDMGVDTTADAPPPKCRLLFVNVAGKPIDQLTKISGDLDEDAAKPGIQIDVEVGGQNLSDGTPISLTVTGLSPNPSANVSAGSAVFNDVTISTSIPGGKVLLVASAAGCESARKTFDVEPQPECLFVAPTDGALLGKAQDKNPANSTFDFDVWVQTKNANGGTVSLRINSQAAGQGNIPGDGRVLFADSVFAPGQVSLEAEVDVSGVKATCKATVTLKTGDPACALTINPPAVKIAGGAKDGLGIAQDAQPSSGGIDTNVTVTTEPDATVTLLVDGQPGSSATADNSGVASFNALALADGERVLAASCLEKGTANTSQSTPLILTVDSQAPVAPSDFSCKVDDNRTGKVTCSWTSAGSVAVSNYRVRYSTTEALTDATWASAQATEKAASPFPATQPQSVSFAGLGVGTYYISLRAEDEVLNVSALVGGTALAIDFREGSLVGVPEPAGATAEWGASMASGDFNCDGFADLAVGDPTAFSNVGRVSIYLGSSAGFLATPTKFIAGTVAGGRFGSQIAALPNFNADAEGCADLAVVASHGDTSAAKVYVYLGRKQFFDRKDVTPGVGAELVLKLASSAGPDEVIGQLIANAGDFNGDGASDLAILHRDNGAQDSSNILIVFGDSSLTPIAGSTAPTSRDLPTAAGVLVVGGKASTNFGAALAGGLSLDGDNFADLVVGEPGTTLGKAYVIKGAQASGSVLLGSSTRVIEINGTTGNSAFGSSVAIVGDMDQDGTAEFAVSDPAAPTSNEGVVYVFTLKTANPASVTDALFQVTNDVMSSAGDRLGIAIANGGAFGLSGADVNGDGYADLLVAAQAAGAGAAVVYQINGGVAPIADKRTSVADYVFQSPTGAVNYGANLVWGGDIDGDGFNDVVISDPLFVDNAVKKGRISYFY
jgi:hypothetical protein